jgi:hypothetical protein
MSGSRPVLDKAIIAARCDGRPSRCRAHATTTHGFEAATNRHRLRESAPYLRDAGWRQTADLLIAAADEIDALRAAISGPMAMKQPVKPKRRRCSSAAPGRAAELGVAARRRRRAARR